MTTVSINTYTHSAAYVADNILKSLKDIVRMSDLDSGMLADNWNAYMQAAETWLDTGHLEKIILEVFNPSSDALIVRWSIDIAYGWSGDGSFWADTEQLKCHIRKIGQLDPSVAACRIVLTTKSGRPDVDGWKITNLRSKNGFIRHSLGSTINHNELYGNPAYRGKK
ncbi:MAG: HORMA domain containing protein [Hyphomicrobiales bacterium]|nr:HORMA domain containing protein [Hyphomicrobiales bacterium]